MECPCFSNQITSHCQDLLSDGFIVCSATVVTVHQITPSKTFIQKTKPKNHSISSALGVMVITMTALLN
jgi:hypothetical protein